MKTVSLIAVGITLLFVVLGLLLIGGLPNPQDTSNQQYAADDEIDDVIVETPPRISLVGSSHAVTGDAANDHRVTMRTLEDIEKPPVFSEDVHLALSRQANVGDGRAAFKLYLALSYCNNFPRSPAALTALVDEVEGTKSYRGMYLDDPGPTINDIEDGFRYCERLSDDEVGRYFDWLVLAAEAGLTQAQLAFAVVEPPEALYFASEDPSVQQRIADLRAASVRHLKSAAGAGSVAAMNWLALTYHQGVVADRDPMQAYAYIYAANAVRELAGTSKAAERGLLERLARELSPMQVEEAQRRAEKYLQRPECCAL